MATVIHGVSHNGPLHRFHRHVRAMATAVITQAASRTRPGTVSNLVRHTRGWCYRGWVNVLA